MLKSVKRILILATCILGLSWAAGLKPLSHVFVIVLENHAYQSVIHNPNMPLLNHLAASYGLAANYYGVTHPSLPNYVALISGHTFGSHSDDPAQRFAGKTLVQQMMTKGLSWKGYIESLPSPGYTGDYAGSPMVYAKKHDPFMLFTTIVKDRAIADRVVPLSQLEHDLNNGQVPNLAFIVPNICHDMHGGYTCTDKVQLERVGDAFVGRLVKHIMASPAWIGNAVIFVTFDEGSYGISDFFSRLYGGGRVATIVIAKTGVRSYISHTRFDHYSLLRTLEEAWNLPLLGHAKEVHDMSEFFR